jgi:catechol 2,3-dioxygenase-like lactoylglutathione lyase family enzyme
MAASQWPDGVAVTQLRIARPTDKLDAVVAFYRDGLGLPVLGAFSGHAGFDGIFLGLPGREVHLEFVRNPRNEPCPAPTRDNLLVLYIPDPEHLARLEAQLAALGHRPVEPDNPYWLGRALTYEDPDGWRVVLCRDPAGI